MNNYIKEIQIDDAVKSLQVNLEDSEISYLEEPYIPHELVGVMAQNKKNN